MKKNAGVIDRLLRLVGVHFIISYVDLGLVSNNLFHMSLSILALYLIVTLVFGFDPIYKFFDFNTLEKTKKEN